MQNTTTAYVWQDTLELFAKKKLSTAQQIASSDLALLIMVILSVYAIEAIVDLHVMFSKLVKHIIVSMETARTTTGNQVVFVNKVLQGLNVMWG